MRYGYRNLAVLCTILMVPGGLLFPAWGQQTPQPAPRPTVVPEWVAPPKQVPRQPQSEDKTSTDDKPTQQSAGILSIDPATCARLYPHKPAADVAYRPGVDVQGRAVVPADLSSDSTMLELNRIEIGITIDLAQRLGIPATVPFRSEAYLGTVTVEKTITGERVLLNGRPLDAPGMDGLALLCQNKAPSP